MYCHSLFASIWHGFWPVSQAGLFVWICFPLCDSFWNETLERLKDSEDAREPPSPSSFHDEEIRRPMDLPATTGSLFLRSTFPAGQPAEVGQNAKVEGGGVDKTLTIDSTDFHTFLFLTAETRLGIFKWDFMNSFVNLLSPSQSQPG